MRLVSLLMIGMLLAAAPARAGELTEAEVKAFLAQMQRALDARDADGLEKLIAADASFVTRVTAQGEFRSQSSSRQELLRALKTLWSNPGANYQANFTADTYMLVGDKAIVSGTGIDTIELDGSFKPLPNKSTRTLQRVNGALLLTKSVDTVQR